jgi:hypothetical protein
MMKRLCALLILLCTMSLGASAQWYLFPGKKKRNEKKTVVDTVRQARPDSSLLRPGSDTLVLERPDTLLTADTLDVALDDVFVLDVPSIIHVALALPLQASGDNPSNNFLDFYSGALLALRDLGNDGLRVDLEVYDSADSKSALPQSLIDDNDVILGPVTLQDIEDALPLCGPGKVIISPLEPKAAELAASNPVVQSPSPWTAQYDEMLRWIREELPVGDELYVVRDTSTAAPAEQSAYLMERLAGSGIRFRSVLSAPEIPFVKDRITRVVIASDNEGFITSAIRHLSIEGARNSDVILYGTSGNRPNSIGQTDLHNTQAHLTLSYFIDYDDPKVRDFIFAYRALFQNDPGSFSFQGYDTMRYFVTMCTRYGRQWYKKLPDYAGTGLQSDFRFTKTDGRVNQAVRRVIYNQDLTTTVAR